ncbi:MAG: DUF4180 domain-containing protein [Hyphomonadaceae bacterium JAD_PAG50586_4]|nr:MAG: DUF4180 domain-containing protein [Hyphomonadaceae bacterium JAD_PAG50586_4]
MIVYSLHGERVAEISHRGGPLESERDATDLIAEAMSSDARLVAIPAERLSSDFFQLSTRKAGHFIQKFVNYRLRIAILGDISHHVEQSAPLADFVRRIQSWAGRLVRARQQRIGHAAGAGEVSGVARAGGLCH